MQVMYASNVLFSDRTYLTQNVNYLTKLVLKTLTGIGVETWKLDEQIQRILSVKISTSFLISKFYESQVQGVPQNMTVGE